MFYLTTPRHISTLPNSEVVIFLKEVRLFGQSRQAQQRSPTRMTQPDVSGLGFLQCKLHH